MELYYEPDSEFREPLTDVDAFLDSARYNEAGDLDLLKAYLEKNPNDVDARDEQGRTAVHMAAANGHMPILEMLFQFNPQPNLPNDEGNTALHFAALNNRVAAAEALLAHGWRAAEQNVMGKTALQLIYEKQYNEMETLLMSRDETLDTYIPPNQASVMVDLSVKEGDEEDDDEQGEKPTEEMKAVSERKMPSVPIAPAKKNVSCASKAPAPAVPVDATTSTQMLGSASVDGIE
ncbi:ankyrin/TPR repeat protein [Leishmania tarentolae]|uniref:Ankyrin/TPR repeat protein n=1 Tax=Leishmania tarentolae TaxID=5689 RepID=A0A640KJV0_LEITA|nr:ankyrin/TPR repeat protein [Leishmania tarentolae]